MVAHSSFAYQGYGLPHLPYSSPEWKMRTSACSSERKGNLFGQSSDNRPQNIKATGSKIAIFGDRIRSSFNVNLFL